MSFAVVVSDIAPLYTKPEPLCELADEALYGMVLEVLAREGMYCRVRTHYRYEGWTPARCLLEDGALAAQWQSVPKLVVQKPYIDVLNEPKVQGGCLQSMPRGAFLCPEDVYKRQVHAHAVHYYNSRILAAAPDAGGRLLPEL